jgi:GxxExxY protein
MNEVYGLADVIRQTGFEIHKYFGNGFLEKVYENSLAHRLRKAGCTVEQQVAIKVYDEDDFVVGDYVADLMVNNMFIVELKAAKALSSENEAQVLHYLKATKKRHGMLLNFGAPKYEVHKYIL